jgi:hypothetical protein
MCSDTGKGKQANWVSLRGASLCMETSMNVRYSCNRKAETGFKQPADYFNNCIVTPDIIITPLTRGSHPEPGKGPRLPKSSISRPYFDASNVLVTLRGKMGTSVFKY